MGEQTQGNRWGCMGWLLLVMGLFFIATTIFLHAYAFHEWSEVPHVTATVLGDEAVSTRTQGNTSTTCTRYYQVPGYADAKSRTVSCFRFFPSAPEPGEAVEVAYDGTGSPIAWADVIGVGGTDLAALVMAPIGLLLLVFGRRR